MAETYLTATFAREDRLIEAVRRLRESGQPIEDILTPYPIHALDALLGRRRSRLGWVTLAAGLAGGASAFLFQVWALGFDWPANVGGKPELSFLAYIPITFEITILAAGLATVAAFLLRSRLYPGSRPRRPLERTTDDRFALILDPQDGAHSLRDLLSQSGVENVEERRYKR